MRNLNIKDDETFEIASRIAKRTGQSLKHVVREALQEHEQRLTKDEQVARLKLLSIKSGALYSERERMQTLEDLLYDERGLPK